MKTLRDVLDEHKISLIEKIKIIDGFNEFELTRGKLEGTSFKFYLDLPVLVDDTRGEYFIADNMH